MSRSGFRNNKKRKHYTYQNRTKKNKGLEGELVKPLKSLVEEMIERKLRESGWVREHGKSNIWVVKKS